MNGAIVKSSIVASSVAAILVAAALTAGGALAPATKVGLKGDLVMTAAYHACDAGCRDDAYGLGGYRTSVEVDKGVGTITLERAPTIPD